MTNDTQPSVTAEKGKPKLDAVSMTRRKRMGLVTLWFLVFLALYFVQEANFLLFHSLAELFSIVIAGGVFLVAWNSRRRLESNFLIVIGIAYASVAFIDAIHMFAYAGMGVFPEHGSNLPTQLWLAARYVEAISLIVAVAFIANPKLDSLVSFASRDRDTLVLLLIYLGVTTGFVGAIFLGRFPDAYIEGEGLTAFKITSEYVIMAFLVIALGVLSRHRSRFESLIFSYFAMSILLTIGAEFAFTQYGSVYGLPNMIGHLLKIVSFYLIYVAVIKSGIAAPQELLFRQLTQERDKLADRERQLERQNSQLEKFANIVSHDLRNPLNVATGRLELAHEEYDSEHLDSVARAHDRMNVLIDDLLDLARAREIDSTMESIDLEASVEKSWENVRTADATLKVGSSPTILADRSRLLQLLENLFRNAIEHAGEDVTVTVGGLADGFYIEDEGPGIPVKDREAVFEAGHTSSPEGTGFGLSIVKEVTEAHGWQIQVSEGAEGGARFEITGVEFAE